MRARRPRRSPRFDRPPAEKNSACAPINRVCGQAPAPSPSPQHMRREPLMRYQLAPLFCRPWTLNGMTPRVIESHYEINYGGAVNRLNAVTAELESLDPATTRPEIVRRLKRDQFTALNATLLHE